MEGRNVIRVVACAIAMICCLLPWYSVSGFGVWKILTLGALVLCALLIFIRDMEEFIHFVSLLPLLTVLLSFVVKPVAAAGEVKFAFGIYLALVFTLINSAVFWMFHTQITEEE